MYFASGEKRGRISLPPRYRRYALIERADDDDMLCACCTSERAPSHLGRLLENVKDATTCARLSSAGEKTRAMRRRGETRDNSVLRGTRDGIVILSRMAPARPAVHPSIHPSVRDEK